MKRTIEFVANGIRCRVTAETKAAQLRAAGRTIDLESIPADALELSISGDADGHGGQCVDTIREAGAGNPDVERLCDLWDHWHLNGLKPGTRAQEAHLASLPPFGNIPDAFTRRKEALERIGLQPDKGYSYGSAWLYEPLPGEVLEELDGLLSRLDGKRIGTTPDLDEAPEVDSDADVIDSRDVIKRLEIYRAAVEALGIDPETVTVENMEDDENADTVEEFIALRDLERSASDAADWRYGVTLIRDSYFEDYAKELADDIGAIDNEAKWPANHIDWGAAAAALQQDYISVEFKGETYWARS